MAAFILRTASDSSYDKIMEYLISKSLMFNKDTSGGPISLEIHGNTEDYNHFKRMIESGQIIGIIEELI